MSIPQGVLLARLANLLESARLEARDSNAYAAEQWIIQAQELLEVARDQA